MIDKNSFFKISNNFVLITVENSNFLMPNTSEGIIAEKLFSVDEIGKIIISNLDGSSSVNNIINTICETYDIDEKTVESDTVNFLEELIVNGIIEE